MRMVNVPVVEFLACLFRHGQPDELIEVPTDPSIIWHGWLEGGDADIPKMRSFGFTGEMKKENLTYHPTSSIPDWEVSRDYISHVNATTEVMERACKEWPGFNWKSFTAIRDGVQLPRNQQYYWQMEDPNE